MTKKNLKPGIFLAVAVLLGVFGVTGVMSASNKTEQANRRDSVTKTEASKPLIFTDNENSVSDDSVVAAVESTDSTSLNKPELTSASDSIDIDDDLELESELDDDSDDAVSLNDENNTSQNNRNRHSDDD